ncbi:hypothetical protein CK203_111743 [Vitis vinifera]|uniref:Uncharacterized protein n=1 Tax=Vitis vinifera TaxID=29760 RepID=A0A438DNX4_VITVI|nr:hypothetical protein CK203_111743 [Vitis vinifera]
MSANQEVTSSGPCGAAHAKRSVDKLSVKEFRELFCIPNGVSVELTDGEAVSTENNEDHAIFFSKEQFNAGLRFPLPSLFNEFLHFSQIPPTYIHPNMVRVLMGCSILNMLFNLDLSLLEVLFIYSIKKLKTDIFSFVACLPSMQLVTSLPDSTKGAARGHVLVKGIWAGLGTHPDRPFAPNQSLKVPVGGEGLVRLLEQALRDCDTLLSAQNLRSVMKEPQSYVLNILPRRLPEEVVAGEHFVLQYLPFYAAVQKVDARTRKARLTNREVIRKEGLLRKAPGGKRSVLSPAGAPAKKKKKVFSKGKEVKLPTPPKEFVIPPVTYEKEVTIQEPENPLPPSISSGPGHVAGLNHSGPSLSAAARLAFLAEEAASINTSGSPHPNANTVEAVCADVSPLMATPMKEMGQKARACLQSGQAFLPFYRFQETIEVSCSSVQDDHPEGSETEMATETPTVPVVVPDEGGSHVDDAACISAGSFSYAELEEKLKQIPSGSTVAMPSARMFEVVETLVSGLRGMAQQHDHFTDLLRTADYMKAFASQRKNSENQLHLRLEEAEASLSTARGDNEALRADLAEARSREESMDARLHEAEDEVTLLKGEVRQLRTEREELEADYQKQVDDMFFFGYRCCMKKHGIKRDVSSIPPGEEKKLLDKPAP